MNVFTRTFSKIFKSSNQQELDKIQNLILAINNKESEVKSLSETGKPVFDLKIIYSLCCSVSAFDTLYFIIGLFLLIIIN